jgi:hypothetical protein
MKSKKGAKFERKIAPLLSLWWTAGERSDVFWRVHGSGGRAKRRGRKGLTTAGQDGDMFAADHIGTPFIKTFTMELKKGYTSSSPFDAMDKLASYKPQVFEQWVEQASESSLQAGSAFWSILFCRNRREPMVSFPFKAYLRIKGGSDLLKRTGFTSLRLSSGKVGISRFKDFLECVTPKAIKRFARSLE